MNKKINKVMSKASLSAIFSVITMILIAIPASAADNKKPNTSILPNDWQIENMLNIVLVILTTGVGIAATIAFAVAGFLYATAGSSSQQVQKAKSMILNTIIGLIAYTLMWTFINWLIPGGL